MQLPDAEPQVAARPMEVRLPTVALPRQVALQRAVLRQDATQRPLLRQVALQGVLWQRSAPQKVSLRQLVPQESGPHEAGYVYPRPLA